MFKSALQELEDKLRVWENNKIVDLDNINLTDVDKRKLNKYVKGLSISLLKKMSFKTSFKNRI